MRRDAAVGLLSLAAGGTDALSLLALGVFTSAMSGNAILLGIALGQGSLSGASRSALAFGGYAAGVAVASAMGSRTRLVLLAEAVLLGTFAGLWPVQVHVIRFPIALSPGFLPVLTAVAGAAMGMQAQAARRMNAHGINTVVFTSTFTDIVGTLTASALGRTARRLTPRTIRQIGAFVLYIAGAAGLDALALHDLPLAPLATFACVLLAAFLDRQDDG